MTMQDRQNVTVLRMKRTWVLGFLVLTLILGACSEGLPGPTVVREETFSVGASPRLIVDNRNGDVTVRVNSAGTISVHATLRNPEELEYQVQVNGDTVQVSAKPERSGFFNIGDSPGADLIIEVPSNTVVDSRSSNGSIELTGFSGPSTARTSNGAIELRDVSGEFLASTSNGRITVTRSTGAFDLKTSNGAISCDGGLDLGGDNRMETSNGSIEVTLGAAPSVRLDARTSNGSIGSSLQFSSSTIEDDHLVGTLGDGDANLHIETSNGSINIR